MNRYEPSIPRAGFALAAVALAAVTFSVTIELPVWLGMRSHDGATIAAQDLPRAAEVAAPLRVDVIGVREVEAVAVPVRAKAKPAAKAQVTAVLCPDEAKAPAAQQS